VKQITTLLPREDCTRAGGAFPEGSTALGEHR